MYMLRCEGSYYHIIKFQIIYMCTGDWLSIDASNSSLRLTNSHLTSKTHSCNGTCEESLSSILLFHNYFCITKAFQIFLPLPTFYFQMEWNQTLNYQPSIQIYMLFFLPFTSATFFNISLLPYRRKSAPVDTFIITSLLLVKLWLRGSVRNLIGKNT